MDIANPLVRSGELMSADDTGLLVVDVQEKLIGLLPGHQRLVWNIRRLLDAAAVLGVPVLASEQYPQGLGPTVEPLASRLPERVAKQAFSCCGADQLAARLIALELPKWLVVGIEAHVCVQQTVLDLLAGGYRVYVAADAVGSRFDVDFQMALQRMTAAGATLTTTEAAMFEWCEQAGTPQFKQISQLVRETPPAG
jgi:nicotinamidase-related amidase